MKKRRIDWTGLLALTVLGAVASMVISMMLACGGPANGKIYDKKYQARYTYATNQCLMYNDAGVCTFNMPTFHEEPEHFYICLDNGEDRGCNEVDAEIYHEAKLGDWYGVR